MKISTCDSARALERTARRREDDAEEAVWGAQLRRMSGHRIKHAEPVTDRRFPSVPMALKIVRGVTCHDSLLLPRTLPAFTGSEREDLVCGECSDVIGARTSPPTASLQHPEGDRVIIRCTCGALNLLCQRREPRRGAVAGAASPAAKAKSKCLGLMRSKGLPVALVLSGNQVA